MTIFKSSFGRIILRFSNCFTRPSFQNFSRIVQGWILTPGRKTITRIIQASGMLKKKHFSVYSRFFSRAIWRIEEFSRDLSHLADKTIYPDQGTIYTVGDDTVYAKSGRKVYGAGLFRDAVLSKGKEVTRWGLNFVTFGITTKIQPDAPYLCLPVLTQLHQKGKNTPAELMVKSLKTFAQWFPERKIKHAGDGYYSNEAVIGPLPKNVEFTGRVRRDAALYEIPLPSRRPKRGRPRKKGKRLPAPKDWANWFDVVWQKVKITLYGEEKELMVKQKRCLWYKVGKKRPLNLLLVRDVKGKLKEECFFTTDLSAGPEGILREVERRYSIEVMHKDSKQVLGVSDGQSRSPLAVKRQIPFGLGLMSLIIIWYLLSGKGSKSDYPKRLPWYKQKSHPCFMDMLACLRRALWEERFLSTFTLRPEVQKILHPLIESLARAG